MQFLLTSLATALSMEPSAVRAGVGVVLEAMAAGGRPADWAALREQVPESASLLDPRRRAVAAGGLLIGPPLQGPSGVHQTLLDLGLGRWRAVLLISLTLRHLEERAGEELIRSLVDAVPSLDLIDDEAEIETESPVADTEVDALPPLDLTTATTPLPRWLRTASSG